MAWTRAEAILLCKELEAIAPNYGFHVALTGGLLYKDGRRKDADILFYRIRQQQGVLDSLLSDIPRLIPGFVIKAKFGFVTKAEYKGKGVDILYPEWVGESKYDNYPEYTCDDILG